MLLRRRNTSNTLTSDGSTNGSTQEQLAALRDEVPEVEETVEQVDRALRESPVEEQPVIRGCGCWE